MTKQLFAFCLAVCLTISVVLCPVRVRAMAGVLTAASAGVVVTAALMASGIYPYEQQKQFSEYVSNNLSALWNQYIKWRQSNIGSVPETGSELSSLTGYLASNTVVIAKKVWGTLSDFVTWIVGHFSLANNQSGVNLGTIGLRIGELPVLSGTEWGEIMSDGIPVYTSHAGASCYMGALSPGFFFVVIPRDGSPGVYLYNIYTTNSNYNNQVYTYNTRFGVSALNGFQYYASVQWKGQTVHQYCYSSDDLHDDPPILLFASEYDALTAIFGSVGTLSGITVDTTSISPLPALEDGKDWGGLQVQGALNPAGTVEQGVTAREKPVVRPVAVEVQQGTKVDSKTGEVEVTDGLVITPQSVSLVVSDYQIVGLSTVFPFSIPWDIARVFQAFNAAPRCPLDDWSVTLPFGDFGLWSALESPTVSFNLSQLPEVRQKIDQIAVVCRSFLLVLACLLWLLFLAKFVRF